MCTININVITTVILLFITVVHTIRYYTYDWELIDWLSLRTADQTCTIGALPQLPPHLLHRVALTHTLGKYVLVRYVHFFFYVALARKLDGLTSSRLAQVQEAAVLQDFRGARHAAHAG